MSKEKIKQERQKTLQDIRRQIGTLKFNEFSPEIQTICDQQYEAIKRKIIAEHGSSGWNSVSHKIRAEVIEPKIPDLILDLQVEKKSACRKQLLELFKNEFTGLSSWQPGQLIDKFLDGNDKPLLDQLVSYDRKQVAKKIKEVYPEHTEESLDSALNSSLFKIDEIVDRETEKALEQHKKQLKIRLGEREKLEKSFVDLGFAANVEEIDLKGTCLWVPASFRHDVDKGYSRAVYGGVRIAGIARFIDPKSEAILARQTTFAARQLWHNRIVGDAFRDMLAHGLQQHGLHVEKEVPKQTQCGIRRIDIEVWRNGVCLGGIEVKSGNPPRTTSVQEARDAWLLQNKNYRVNTVYYQYP